MNPDLWANVVVAGVHNTKQARQLPGETSASLQLQAIHGALDDAGLTLDDVDGVSASDRSRHLAYDLSIGPAWVAGPHYLGIQAIIEAALAIATAQADVVVLVAGAAGMYVDRDSTAPWTRPENEFVAPWGLFTASEFALVARAHMTRFGTTPEQLARVAATIRNNGHVNPEAVYYDKGPFKPDDILASRMVTDPFHLLDCSTASEGGCALVLVNADRTADLRKPPVRILGAAHESFGPAYQHPPSFDLTGRRDDGYSNGWIGERGAQRMFAASGTTRDDVDVLEFYDPFSFEIIRQLEAFGFCPKGDGGAFVEEGHIEPGGALPVTTDGGTMSFSHTGNSGQMMQRVIRGVQQVRGECPTAQVPGANVALCTNGGAGGLFHSQMLVAKERP